MTRVCIVFAALVAVSLPVGCKRDTDLPPEFVGGDGTLPPIRVSERVGEKGIVGSVPPTDEPSRPGPGSEVKGGSADVGGEPDRGNIEIDDSTPRGVVEAYVAVQAAGQLDGIVPLLVPEQQEAARKVVEAIMPAAKAFQRLERAWEAKFPGEPMAPEGAGFSLKSAGVGEAPEIRDVAVDPDNADKATATLEAASGKKTLELTRIDGHWRIRDPEVPTEEAELEMALGMMQMLKGMVQVVDGIAERIEAGEFTAAEAARKALEEAFKAAGDGAAAPPGGGGN